MTRWLRFLKRPDVHVSERWLTDLDRKASRVEFEGVRIQFPIRKLLNEASPRMNAERLRKRWRA